MVLFPLCQERPAIFEKKSKWALPEESVDSWDGERWWDNYVSAAELHHSL